MTTDIATQVKNYKGTNSFILKMKDAMTKYGSLTANQRAAVEKIFNNPTEVKAVEMTDDMKKIAAYEGENSFVIELKGKLAKYGKLSDKQISAALSQIQKEENKAATVNLNIRPSLLVMQTCYAIVIKGLGWDYKGWLVISISQPL